MVAQVVGLKQVMQAKIHPIGVLAGGDSLRKKKKVMQQCSLGIPSLIVACHCRGLGFAPAKSSAWPYMGKSHNFKEWANKLEMNPYPTPNPNLTLNI